MAHNPIIKCDFMHAFILQKKNIKIKMIRNLHCLNFKKTNLIISLAFEKFQKEKIN